MGEYRPKVSIVLELNPSNITFREGTITIKALIKKKWTGYASTDPTLACTEVQA